MPVGQGTTGAAGCSLAAQMDGRNLIEQEMVRDARTPGGPGGQLGRLVSGRAVHLLVAFGKRKYAIDIYDHIRFEGDERGLSCVLSAIWYLIDIAPGIKLQNKDHLACLIYIINKPVFAKSYPESGLMPFALFNIKIGR
jgi:hypothetical protein